MKTYEVIWNAIRVQPWNWFFNLVGITVLYLSFQIPALVLREFFNLITGDAEVDFDFWTLVAFMAASALVRIGGELGIVLTNVPMMYNIAAWLQKNMFNRILHRPGAAALPNSSGEAISRFRGDPEQVYIFPLWINDVIGSVVYSSIALVIMLGIAPKITLVACIPVVFVVLLTTAMTRHISHYRRLSREATGAVTGFIGETFGAVQGIKVANAEKTILGRFRTLNHERSQTALKDHLFDELREAVYSNAVALGTGIILIMAATAIREERFLMELVRLGKQATQPQICLGDWTSLLAFFFILRLLLLACLVELCFLFSAPLRLRLFVFSLPLIHLMSLKGQQLGRHTQGQ